MATPGQRRRTAFREEFYAGRGIVPKSSDDAETPRRAEPKGRRTLVPFWILAGLVGITFCMIAIGGSVGMIYLREIAGFFGVHWVGD